MKETFVVIHQNELKHHPDLHSAEKEAIRLINKTGYSFYIARVIKLGHPAEVVFDEVADCDVYIGPFVSSKAHLLHEMSKLLASPKDRYGHPWSELHDALLLFLYDDCHHTVRQLAHIFGRSDVSIRCRLEKYNRYNAR